MSSSTFFLNDQQQKAVQDTEGQILVTAGAGSGKTRVLTARVCHLVEMGVNPYNILAITFTNKAAGEMKERIVAALGAEGASVWTSTFHSMCAKILRIDGDKLGYTSDYSIYTDIETARVVKRVMDAIPASNPKKKDNYIWHISHAKTVGMSPEEYFEDIRADVQEADIIFNVYANYERELKRSNALDFDDLLLKTVELFQTNKDVLEKYQNRFRYINVDEFQDTNTLQYTLVKLLAGRWKNLFVVGDEDQSIYGWRGAEIKNILGFSKDYPDAKKYKLEQNYRSTPCILTAANNVIKHNQNRNEKTLWSENQNVAPVEYYDARNDRDEAEYVARKINFLRLQGEPYKEMAVLVRVNSITRLFEEAFNLYGIPYKVFGGFRFFERKEIKDALAYVRLALNPSDNDSLVRIINYPKRGIGDKAVEDILACAAFNNLTAFQVVINADSYLPSMAKKIAPFVDIATDLISSASKMSPKDFMEYVIKRSSLESTLAASKDPDDENRLENIQELVNAIDQFVADNPDASLNDFMQSVALISDTDEMDEDNYVTIATIHAVKGLEFDNVFIVGLEETVFPVQRAMDSGEVEEERRLMYVAITRARKRLYAVHAKSRFRFYEVQYNPESRFVEEMQGEVHVGSIRKPTSGLSGFDSPQKNAWGGVKANSYGNNKWGAQKSGANQYGSSSAAASKPMSGAPQYKPSSTNANVRNVDLSAYEKDTVVEHNKFGRGIIISTSGEGQDKVAAIAFKGLGVKRFALIVAAPNLKIVKEDKPEE